jgi:hypothetical protein
VSGDAAPVEPRAPAAGETGTPAKRSETPAPAWYLAFAHLAGLWGLAVAQPIFDVLGDAPDYFVAQAVTGGDIVLFALVTALAPPLALALLEVAVGAIRPTLRRRLHLVAITLIVALLALQVLSSARDGPAALLVASALAAGIGGAALYDRAAVARLFLSVISPAAVVFVGLFLLSSPVEGLVFDDDAGAPRPAATSARTPIVVAVFDEFPVSSLMRRDGRINADRFPNFARFAATSTWYRNATTAHAATFAAVPAILTGRVPEGEQLPVLADHKQNLFTLLGGAYRLHVSEAVTRLCPESLCPVRRAGVVSRVRGLVSDASLVYGHAVLPDGLRSRLPSVTDSWLHVRGGGAVDLDSALSLMRRLDDDVRATDPTLQFARFLNGIRRVRSGKPPLHFVHVGLPHAPWNHFPSGVVYAGGHPDAVEGDRWVGDPVAPRSNLERHLLQVGYVDRLLGRMVARLRSAELFDSALVVLVADHGASFRAGNLHRGLTRSNLSDIAYVPLFVKMPSQRTGRTVERHVRTVDVLPTIADVARVRLPGPVAGTSLAGAASRPLERVSVADWNGTRLTVDERRLRAERDATVRRLASIFGMAGFDRRFFAFDSARALVGRRVGASVALADGVSAVLSNGSRQERTPSYLPAYVRGRLTGPEAAAGTIVAFALNGVVVATTHAYREDGRTRFTATLPPWSYGSGRKTLRLFIARSPTAPLRGVPFR